jgi:hypothetical protein
MQLHHALLFLIQASNSFVSVRNISSEHGY